MFICILVGKKKERKVEFLFNKFNCSYKKQLYVVLFVFTIHLSEFCFFFFFFLGVVEEGAAEVQTGDVVRWGKLVALKLISPIDWNFQNEAFFFVQRLHKTACL